MNDLFLKLTSDFKINFDLDKMLSKFSYEYFPKPNTGVGYVHEFKGKSEVYWQNYYNGTAFARGLDSVFPDEVSDILHQIKLLQQTVSGDNLMIKRFKEAVIDAEFLHLVRIKGRTNAEPHTDGNRDLALNIGLRNSLSRETIISEDKNIKNFWNSKLHTFQMEDGHAYLFRASHPHAVKSKTTEGWLQPRYLISCSIK